MPRKIKHQADKWGSVSARNTQLWAYLNGFGLYVDAVRPTGPDGKELEAEIDCLIVSVAPPTVQLQVAEDPTLPCVSAPMERTHVPDVVGSPEDAGRNVVDFPSPS